MTGDFYPVFCASLALLAAPAFASTTASALAAAGTAARPLNLNALTGCTLNGPCSLGRFSSISGTARKPVPGRVSFAPPERNKFTRTFDAGFTGWGRSKRMAHCIAQKPPRPPRQYIDDATLQWEQERRPFYTGKIRGYEEFPPSAPSSLAVYSYCLQH